jgi:4-amino-4-deoxy-L-arabinose transferase-like glycosyltransferase
MNNKIVILLLILIVFFGTLLRFYKLGEVPNSLSWDEVSWGYNSYSILLTGKDEHGAFLPLSFQAFGDFKQPIYVYLGIMPIKIFGLMPFAVRFPSAFLGSLSIIFVYFLVYEIFRREKHAQIIALLSSLFYAFSPWSIQFSRVAYEANAGLFFVIAGCWSFVRGINLKNNILLFLSAMLFSISAYTYHSEKIFTPLLFIGLLIIHWRHFFNKKTLLSIFVAFYMLCNIFWIVDMRTTARGRSVTFFSNQTQVLQKSTEKLIADVANNDKLGQLFENRRVAYANKYFENYLAHFDLNFLFITGDNARHHAPGVGILYLSALPLILLGMFFVIKNYPYAARIIFLWFLLAPVASALAVDAPNASRSMIFLPTWDIFSGIGLFVLFKQLNRGWISTSVKIVVIITLFLNVLYYAHNYFQHTNTDFDKYWQYGYEQSINYTKQYVGMNKRIFFANDIEQGYIFYLFYNKYDPQKYLSNGGSDRIKNECYSIDNAYFGTCDNKIKKGDIYVTSKEQASPNLKVIKRINYSSGETGVWIFEYL